MSMDGDIPTDEVGVPSTQARELLQQVRLFQGLDAAAIEAISTRLHRRAFTAGDVLIEQDRWSGELFILRSGVAQVGITRETTRETLYGLPESARQEIFLRRLVGGDLVGEMSLITGSPPSATVRALTDGDLWALGHDDFHRLGA